MWFHGICDCLTGKNDEKSKKASVEGTVILVKKNVLDFNDYTANLLDGMHELLHHGVSFQLVSSTHIDPDTKEGKLGKEAELEEWITGRQMLKTGESKFKVHFEWDEGQGIPGAVIVKNHHHSEFYLKTLTLEEVPGKGKVHFVCNSWVYPANNYNYDRVFFTNDTYLPSKMPEALVPYKEREFVNLRGDKVIGGVAEHDRELKEHDRIYDYALYDDLGTTDNPRPILGGTPDKPYPRRGRTNRKHVKNPDTSDNREYETRLSLINSLSIYIPRDEKFGHLKLSDFLAYALKSLEQSLFPGLTALFDKFDKSHDEFDSFRDTLNLYEGGLPLPHSKELEDLRNDIPFEMIKELLRTDGAHAFRLPLPEVLQKDKLAWRTDEEFGREMLAGVNPVLIRLLKEFPPASNLDKKEWGDQTSKITEEHIEKNLEGLTVDQALKESRLFILDHHDAFMPYLNEINNLEGKTTPLGKKHKLNFIYATRTLLFLKNDGTLKPLAIELSLPHPDGQEHGAISKVYTPATEGVDEWIWQLAKAYAAVNDSGYHQLISHWLNTHAVIEPFVIATHRQLSVTHPIHKLLSPHYRDTMNINALARQTLINAGGIFESTVFPGKYALSMSSDVYKSWKLTEQGLPDELLKRGVAVKDDSSPYKLHLLIKDYPYAVDGLAVWSAIETWVNEYCSIYYPQDSIVRSDTELQAWWTEIREKGHGDKKDETWWPKMDTVKELTKTCTTIIWVASALHAAVNFGQYPYAGYLPNRPTVSRLPMPEPGDEMYEELKKDPEKVFLLTITSQLQTILGISLIEILSRHSTDEVYLGQRDTDEWTSDAKALDAFVRFGEKLKGIEANIKKMNENPNLKNRKGPVEMPYMFLYPNTSDTSGTGGLITKGIPNSVSI